MPPFTEQQPDIALPPEQVHALNNVNLRLAFGNHGYYNPDFSQGAMVLGINDTTYHNMDCLVGELRPERGDVLAREAVGYKKPWSVEAFVEGLRHTDEYSPHVKTKDFPGITELDPTALAGYVRLTRALRVLDPIDFAECTAVEHGMRVAYADANKEEMDNWESGSLTHYRDGLMVRSLGNIAVGMNRNVDERPTLLFVAGSDHRRGVESRLSTNGVRYSVTSFSPKRRVGEALVTIQCLAALRVPRIVRQPTGRHAREWQKNFRAKMTTGVRTESLGSK